MKYLEDVLIAPVISEKSYDRISDSNSYSFFVHPKTDKPQIKKAVEEMFGVKVFKSQHNVSKRKEKKIWICNWPTKYKKNSNSYSRRRGYY